MKTLCVYMLHWNKLNERMKNIEKFREIAKQQTYFEVDFEIISEHDPETFNLESVKNLIKLEISQNDPFYSFRTQLTQRTISNTLKHYTALQKIASRNDVCYNLVLEDDVEFNVSFFEQLNEIMNSVESGANKTYDVIFLGLPPEPDTDKSKISFQNVLDKQTPLIANDSYIVSHSAAKQLMINFFPIGFDTSVHFTQLLKNHDLKALKTFPNLTGDGSKIGTYSSSVKENNILIFNNDYKSLYRNIESNSSDLMKNESIYLNTQYKEHPDILHMMALTYLKMKNFDQSLSFFQKAYAAYSVQHCLMNKNCVFMKNYITAFKFTQ